MVCNMALLISDDHILFNHMHTFCPCMLGCNFFASPDYLVAKMWIKATVLFLSFIILINKNISVQFKIFPEVVGYWAQGISSQCIVAKVYVALPFALTAYTSL